MRKNKAFTILELVTVMGLLLAMTFFTVPIFIGQLQAARAEAYASQISSNLFLYQQNAYSSKNNSSYGIKFETDKYTLFRGDSLATGVLVLEVTLPNNISIGNIDFQGGSDEIVFSSNDLMPNTTGTLEISDGDQTYTVEINSEGFINYTFNEN